MSTEELENNNQLKDVELYVFLGGKTIKGKTANGILEIMKKCSFVKPDSVIKSQHLITEVDETKTENVVHVRPSFWNRWFT